MTNNDLIEKTHLATRLLAEFSQSKQRPSPANLESLNLQGQWLKDQVKLALIDIAKQLECPDGYSVIFRDYESRKPFLFGDINTTNDLSIYIKKANADPNAEDQFSAEVRLFIDRPKAFVRLLNGCQYAFRGKEIKVFDGESSTQADCHADLVPKIVTQLNDHMLQLHEDHTETAGLKM